MPSRHPSDQQSFPSGQLSSAPGGRSRQQHRRRRHGEEQGPTTIRLPPPRLSLPTHTGARVTTAAAPTRPKSPSPSAPSTTPLARRHHHTGTSESISAAPTTPSPPPSYPSVRPHPGRRGSGLASTTSPGSCRSSEGAAALPTERRDGAGWSWRGTSFLVGVAPAASLRLPVPSPSLPRFLLRASRAAARHAMTRSPLSTSVMPTFVLFLHYFVRRSLLHISSDSHDFVLLVPLLPILTSTALHLFCLWPTGLPCACTCDKN